MREVVISAKTAVSVHGDTVDYRVDSFISDQLATTEDVLKRLPGVDISRDGKIMVDGKPVNKLFINGKEYLSDDLSTIIKNLPAEILEKIQVADYRDEDASFTGSKDNTEEKAINLQMKKKYKGGVYGKTFAGYGTKDRYQAGAFVNYMDGGPTQLMASGGANNTGMGDAGSDDGGNANSTSFASPGVRTSQNGGLNFSYQKKKKIRINVNYGYNHSKSYLSRSSFRTTYLPSDSLLQQSENSSQTNETGSHNLRANGRFQISEQTKYRTGISINTSGQQSERLGDNITYRDSKADVISFERQNTNNTERQNTGIGFNNTLQHKFKNENRRLVLIANGSYNNSGSDGMLNNINNYYFPVSANTVANKTDGKNNSYSAIGSVYFTEPLSKNNKLILRYRYNYQYADNVNNVLVANNNIFLLDTTQSRGYENTNSSHTVGLTYQYSSKSFTAGLGFEAQPYSRKSLQTSGVANDIVQKGINYFPSLYSRYKFSKATYISLNYNAGITQPSLNQLQPIPNYTDSLNIYIGNPNLRPEVKNNIRMRLGSNNAKKGRNLWLNLSGGWVNNKIINNTTITDSRRTTTPFNANGNYQLGSSVGYTEPLIKKKLSLTLYGGVQYSNNVNQTNGVLQNIKNYSYTPGVRLTSYTAKWFEGSLNYDYNRNKVTGAQQTQSLTNNNLYQTHSLAHDGAVIFPAGFRFAYYLDYTFNKGLAQNFQQEFFLVNMMLNKSFSKPAGLSIRLQAYDVFNNYPTVQRSVSDNYYEDVSVNRLGNYFMLSIIYKFTSFPEVKEENEDTED